MAGRLAVVGGNPRSARRSLPAFIGCSLALLSLAAELAMWTWATGAAQSDQDVRDDPQESDGLLRTGGKPTPSAVSALTLALAKQLGEERVVALAMRRERVDNVRQHLEGYCRPDRHRALADELLDGRTDTRGADD
jgi:16S rRNA G1207 methylase RsmC